MKKFIMLFASAIVMLVMLAGCNKQVIDTTYKYSRAQIKMPDGSIVEGKVEKWGDYEGEQIQVKIDGTVYLVNSVNVVLIG